MTDTTDARLIYITTESPDEARAIGAALVEARLAACVNILGPVTSMYRWQGAVAEAEETALIAKTRADLVDALTSFVLEMHSYSCPCIVALPIVGGNPEFLQWIATETTLDSLPGA